MQQSGNPSVEEILESIKKVIARDSREVAAEARRSRESYVLPDAPRPDPIPELTPAATAPVDVLDLAMSAQFLDAEDEDEEEPVDDVDAETPLITADARSAMRQSLAALAMMAEPRAHPQIVRSGETSLEELTRELLRPALAEWLDANLPPLVERLVAAEIARIVGKKV